MWRWWIGENRYGNRDGVNRGVNRDGGSGQEKTTMLSVEVKKRYAVLVCESKQYDE